VFEPTASGDGWLARVKPPKAVLSASAARALAAAAAEFGNGMIELTSRANLQVRGLSTRDLSSFATAIVASGLADPDPATERRRAVIHPPLPAAYPDLASDIEWILAHDPALACLPAKFAVAVDSGGLLPLGQTAADLTVICTERGIEIVPAGSYFGAGVTATAAAAAVRGVALSFLALAEACTPPPHRMRALMGIISPAVLFAGAGLAWRAAVTRRPSAPALGWLPFPNSNKGAVGLGVPFGATTAATVASLADLAERYSDDEMRLTPWRTFLLANISVGDADPVQAAAAQLDLIVDPADRRSTVVTCTGQPRCAGASVDVRTDAALLLQLPLPTPIHVSGCAKGCAHHASAPITLVGEDGRYGIIRYGNARGTPSLRGLTMHQVVDTLKADG
jgi:precorrin-3B synthase